MTLGALTVLFAGLLGLLVGSFSNVLIWRLPRGESVAFPPSHCPNCDHRLGVLDLVPVLSWAALGGKCRYCRTPISPRYPVVELLTGLGYAGVALAFPPEVYGAGTLGLMALLTLLLVGSAIDLDTYTLPDELTLPGVGLGLLFALAGAGAQAQAGRLGLPDFAQAAQGAALGAGVLIAVNLFGSWVLRRFRERRFPERPLGYQQVSLALLVGGWFGPLWGLGAALASAGLNVAARRLVPVPEWLTLGGFLISLALAGPDLLAFLRGGLGAAGAAGLVCGLYWWLYWRRHRAEEAEDAEGDPVAMGFGDVKLAGVIGAFLGTERLLLALAVAVVAGALLGLVQKALKGESRIPFGPYLALGAVAALFAGEGLILDLARQWGALLP
ncbi:leader peptidase (prepilin peptidase) / N-methyltransferase [Deinococcus reticulitermitis]|uniref:Leader peptidase (Prepilin peptidase) / N-methyltransferase n=1 Tax=Deinococcus reticulitermitis TaxID=856736 RepID=A0A1H6U966_9DEIO|nr:prepilin peptidase [Deinococcus reticulitermitis]SEI84775.1 leader peptidase (prepilin peptidase) / N-methyltransferase [Deinococcus reticulitermitis]